MKPRHYLTDSDLENIRRMIEVEGLQQRKVAEAIGVHQGTIERVCRRLGLTTQRSGPRSGELHPDWKGGRVLLKGYWYVYSPGHPYAKKPVPYVAEHRLVMEQKLGRYLLRGEVVHHVDGNPENNDPANLIVFGSNAEHLKHELTGRVPSWTPEGKQKLLEESERRRRYTGTSAERAKQAQRQYDRTHRRKAIDDQGSSQSSDHPTS